MSGGGGERNASAEEDGTKGEREMGASDCLREAGIIRQDGPTLTEAAAAFSPAVESSTPLLLLRQRLAPQPQLHCLRERVCVGNKEGVVFVPATRCDLSLDDFASSLSLCFRRRACSLFTRCCCSCPSAPFPSLLSSRFAETRDERQ